MERLGRHMDRLRRSPGAGARGRVNPGITTEYLSLRPRRPAASASRSGSICTVGELASHQMESRLGKSRASQTLHHRIQCGRGVVHPCVLDRPGRWFFRLAGVAGRGPGVARGERATVVGGRQPGRSAIELAGGAPSPTPRGGAGRHQPARSPLSSVSVSSRHFPTPNVPKQILMMRTRCRRWAL
jgi:hypothetical protein